MKILKKIIKQIRKIHWDSGEFLYYWYCHFFDNYSIIRMRQLPPTYCDPREQLLHAAFQVLVDFVELEKPFENLDWTWSEEKRIIKSEIIDLYEWYTNTRPNRKDPLDSAEPPEFEFTNGGLIISEKNKELKNIWDKAIAESERLEMEWDREDIRNLHRLIHCKNHLWT